MDDPKFIGGTSTTVSAVASWVTSGVGIAWLLSIGVAAAIAMLPKTPARSWWMRCAGLGLGLLALFIASLRYWPGDAAIWFID